MDFKTTKEIKVPEKIVGQVLGQEEAVEIVRKAAKQRRHVFLIGEPGTGKCVGGNTEIITTECPIHAKKLYESLKKTGICIEKDGEEYLITKPTKTFTLSKEGKIIEKNIIRAYKGKRKKAIKILTKAGNEFVVSGEHPVLTLKKDSLAFLPSEELKEGTFIASIRKLPESDNSKLPIEKIKSQRIILDDDKFQYIGKNNIKSLKLRLPKLNSPELSYFIGLCMAEARWQGNLVIYNSAPAIKNKIKKILQELFNYPKEHIRLFENGIFLEKSRTLAHFMERIFDYPLETTKQSTKKLVPKIIFNSNNKLIAAFISGLIDGDGHLGKTFEITLSSKQFIRELKVLLLKLGVHSRISKTKKFASNTKQKIKREYYRLNVYDSKNIIKLFEKLNLVLKYKTKTLKNFATKKTNTNVDVIPNIGKSLNQLKTWSGITFKELNHFPATFRKLREEERNVSRETAQQIISRLKSYNEQNLILQTEFDEKLTNIQRITHSDIFWDQIKSMTLVEEDLYDFEVEETHNLVISSGVVIHNSMLGLALAELLPKEKLVDILAYPNVNDENQPIIKTLPAGKGREMLSKSRIQNMGFFKKQNIIIIGLLILVMIAPWWARSHYKSDLMFATFFLGGMIFLAAVTMMMSLGRRGLGVGPKPTVPKVIVDTYGKKQAPFWDATGAHAGALLGDVLHDPLQSLLPSGNIKVLRKRKWISKSLKTTLDMCTHRLFKSKKDDKNYEAVFTKKNEIKTLGETNGRISPVEILSFNRYNHDGKMIKITTQDNKELVVTPEHKIAIMKHDKIMYIEAQKIKKGDEIFSLQEDIIIDEQDIIKTYDKRQQKQCELYYKYLDIKEKNPTWGYKRIAKAMGQKIGKTRWWHTGKHIPVPVQTCNWLKEKGLLPLKHDDKRISLIAKVLGATFGDGGIFENLNGIFLSSSEKEAVKEFGSDIEKIFELNKNANSRIIEGGEYGHSWCYQNTNRNIIRFFLAIGAPKGNKTKIELYAPQWIKLNPFFESEFWGSFLGGELGVPKIHVSKKSLNTFCVAIGGPKQLTDNRIEFMNDLSLYLQRNHIKMGFLKPTKYKNMTVLMFRLFIPTLFENVTNFSKLIKINYCKYKPKKLINTLNKFSDLKRAKYFELVNRGYGAEHAMKILHLTPAALYMILNYETLGQNEA